MIKKIFNIIILLIFLLVTGGIVAFFLFASRIPRLPDDLKLLASSPPTEVYSRDGDLMMSIGGRSYISLDRISPYFQQAVIAAEDKRFYSHKGIDLIATARSLIQNLLPGGGHGGASTITQQLSKNMFFEFRRSWERKLLEALASFAVEDKFSKEQILEAYCNLIPFGRFAYGVENASQTYFSKHAAELELHEAALLAGLPNSPSRFDPFTNLKRAKIRQKHILNRMEIIGYIPEGWADSLASVPLELKRGKSPIENGSYPLDFALDKASDLIGDDLVNYGGVRIMTTIDPMLQAYAQKAMMTGIAALKNSLKPLPAEADTRLEGALIAVEVATGQIVAMVGGRDYTESTYNRAVYAHRQPGSAFKPVTYLTALEKTDLTPASILTDTLFTIQIDRRQTYTARNFSREYRGPVTMKYALMKSINSIAAQLINIVGPEAVIKSAYRLGVESKLQPYYSTALGGQDVTPLDMARIYSTLARDGVVIESYMVKRIENRGRDLMFESLPAGETRFSPETVYILQDMMRGVMDAGTGITVRHRGFTGTAIGKTGTSNDYRNSWFCGATPSLAVVVWVGYDDNRSMYKKNGSGIVGATGAAPIWADFMIKATAGEPPRNFPRPAGVTTLFMDPIKGTVGELPQENDWITVVLTDEDAGRLLNARHAKISADSLAIRKEDNIANE